MATVDFDSEPAYWYEKTMRDSRAAGLAVRSRPAVSRDERLMALEVARHLNRTVLAQRSPNAHELAQPGSHARICAACGQHFSRRGWNARRLWRVVYPRTGGKLELYRHLICPTTGGGVTHA